MVQIITMKKVITILVLGLVLASFTLVDAFRVVKTSHGITLTKLNADNEPSFFFIPTVTEELKIILDKVIDWQKLNVTHRKDFVKEAGQMNIYASSNHYKLTQSSNYDHSVKFEFQGTSDGGCNLIIKKNESRNKEFHPFHTLAGDQLTSFVAKCGLKGNSCEIDKIFE